ncbi:MAG: sulfotransferase [Desulfobacteraceae bacterium]|nr:sulfotransferase [Desulfobacteraceae bacterium]
MTFQSRREKYYPDFVGIGTTRGGSSWLWHVLSSHPDIWVSPVKELHYFDRPLDGKRTVFVNKRKFMGRIFSYIRGGWNINEAGIKNIIWDYKYFLRKRSEEWYRNLFSLTDNRIAGEVTPAYAIMDEESIKRIVSINPGLRAVYLLRNPIERSWSSIVNGLAKKHKRSIQDVPTEDILRKIELPSFLARSNYAENIRRWRAVIGKENLFIGYFEDIKTQPAALINRICNFLGVRGSEMISDNRLYEPRNSSKQFNAPMPQAIAYHLAKKLYPMIEDASQLLGGYALQWQREAEKILNESTPNTEQCQDFIQSLSEENRNK